MRCVCVSEAQSFLFAVYFRHFRTCFFHVRCTFLLFIWFYLQSARTNVTWACLKAKKHTHTFIRSNMILPSTIHIRVYIRFSSAVSISIMAVCASVTISYVTLKQFRCIRHIIFCPHNFRISHILLSIHRKIATSCELMEAWGMAQGTWNWMK